jgi:hypothetical protein
MSAGGLEGGFSARDQREEARDPGWHIPCKIEECTAKIQNVFSERI